MCHGIVLAFTSNDRKSESLPAVRLQFEPGTSGIRGLLEKYPTFGREKETGLLGALDT